MIHYFFGCALVVLFLLFIRLEVVGSVCRRFIEDDDLFPEHYKQLPSFNSMMVNPLHWRRWTKAQWMRYTKSKTQPR